MAPYRSIWITEILNKESIREKLGSKYGIDFGDLEGYLICNRDPRGIDEDHEIHVLRTVIRLRLPGDKVIRIVISLVNEENNTWIIRTARYSK